MELFEQHLNNTCGSMEYHGIPWNFLQIQSSMEFHGTFSILPSSMEFHGTFNFPQKSSMEFHGIPWNFFWSSMEFHGIPWNLINFIFKKIIFLNIVFGIWLMIRCYLAKISQKRYKLHFQYRNSYFEHPSVSENGTRSAKMACCYTRNSPEVMTKDNGPKITLSNQHARSDALCKKWITFIFIFK